MIKKIFFIVFILIAGLTYSQTGRFVVKSVGINSSDNEFGTVISKDGGVYYSKSNNNGSGFNELSASLYRGEFILKGDISKGLKFPSDATYAVFTKDGRTVYYSKKEGNKFQLYKAYVDETGRWKDNIKLPFNDPNFTFKQPALNQENTKLFFVSDKADSYGGTDIYYVTISNHGLDYGEPKHLNFYVNSPGEEAFPYIGEKDKLYFSSNGMNGLGGLDIFESFYNNGDYEKTSNLGEPINSESDDFAYTLISDNHKGFFSSNRKGGKGGVDIYFFEDYKPTLNNCSESIKGYVKNKENQKPIFEAIVEIFDSKGNNENTLTDKDGSFLIENVECEVTYDIVSYKEGFNGFAEVHVIPKNAETINLYLNPEFPEGYKEEFDFSNEIVVIDTKTNKEIIPEKNDGYDALKSKSQAKDSQVSEEQKALIAEAQQTSNQLKNNPQKKVVEEEWDPLDYDPHSQPKNTVATTTSAKKQEPENTKKEVAQTESWDPLDYDPHTVRKNNIDKSVTVNDNTEKQSVTNQNTKVVDYDPLDYDPHTQSKNQPKKEVVTVDPIEEARLKREAAEQERQKMIAEAKATSNNLKSEQEAKKIEEAKIAEANRLEKEKVLALQKQAIADAKKRDEEERLEQTRLAEANIQKTKQAEADRIEAEKQQKIRLEEERQAAIVAKKQAAEQERQQMIAEAKATSEQLKKEQEAKQLAESQAAETKKQEAEKALAKQNQILADAKKRDEQEKAIAVNNQQTSVQKTTSQEQFHTVQKGEGLYSIAKNSNMTVDELKELNGLTSNTINVGQKLIVNKSENELVTNNQNNDLVTNNSVKELTQKEKLEQERQQMIAEAKATSEQLKKEQEAKQLADVQAAETKKQEAEKALAKQNQILADAKKRDEQEKAIVVNNQQTSVEKTTSQEQFHTVQKGEGLYSIAKNNNMTVDELKELNGLTSNTINIGQKLIVNKSENELVTNNQNNDLVTNNSVKELTQKEKLEQERQQMIAEAKATSEQLKKEQEAKQLAESQAAETKKQETEKALALQKQAIADAKKRDEQEKAIAVNNQQTSVEKTTSQEQFHTVQKGEGLYSIAKNNNMTVDELKELNGLTSNTIYSGQKLLVSKSNENIVSPQVKENPIAQKEVAENKTLTSAQLKQQQEEQARLDRIAKAKATAEQLKKEKEQSQLAQTDVKKLQPEKTNVKNETENGVCVKNINGYIKNSLNKKLLGQVRIDMYFEGQNIESTTTNASGEFFFNNVDCDTKYTLICYKEGFQNIAKAVVDTQYDPKDITILLDPTSTDGVVAVKQNVTNPVTKTTQSQQDNSIAQNQKVQPKTNVVNPTQTKKSQNLDEDDGMTYYVEPEKVEMPKIEEGKVVLNPIYFDLDEWYLTVPARKELDRIILLLKMNPTMVIESGSHTDTRGNFDYNLELSEKRSQETVGYMIANGADPDRISGRGYGETMPVNHCLDGVKCTEKEHLQNRRTEFVILKY